MRDFDAFLKALVSNDRQLADEIRTRRDAAAQALARARGVKGSARGVRPTAAAQASLRTIVLRTGRPVLPIVNNAAQLSFTDRDSEVWRSRLERAQKRIIHAARAVGRIDVSGHPQQLAYVGTGWLVEADTLLTNRHVARQFGRRAAQRFTFSRGTDGKAIRSSVDFLEEAGRRDRLEFKIVEILHIEDDDGPDMALLRVAQTSGTKALAAPIALSSSVAAAEQQIAVIGYPARDSRIPDDQLMHDIFGDVYDKKRVAPGQVTAVSDTVVRHDCSTLGGNSGSVLLDLASGKAVGLHFAGRFLESNFAVPARLVAERLDAVRRARGRPSVGHGHAKPSVTVPAVTRPRPAETLLEGAIEDYADRTGYSADFIGVRVPFPVMKKHKADVLTFPWKGRASSRLDYEHFSVVMCKSRRMCFFSACNLDGKQSTRGKRPGWRLDPRIPKTQQIQDECYGDAPKFSRGHMTRREDPVWGEPAAAARGNSDSMHVTNAVPQMQPFNAGIWLALEDYALEHAREDDMRIAVFTGPFLESDDPIRFGVQIPRSFWKVLAFIHDDTGALSATGYTMSQDSFIRDEEFVFAQHQTTQTRIQAIEAKTGISFGPLAAADPFHGDEEGLSSVLTDPSQITFRT